MPMQKLNKITGYFCIILSLWLIVLLSWQRIIPTWDRAKATQAQRQHEEEMRAYWVRYDEELRKRRNNP